MASVKYVDDLSEGIFWIPGWYSPFWVIVTAPFNLDKSVSVYDQVAVFCQEFFIGEGACPMS